MSDVAKCNLLEILLMALALALVIVCKQNRVSSERAAYLEGRYGLDPQTALFFADEGSH